MPELLVSGLLFDLDGTLVDSQASVQRNWRKLADEIGLPWGTVSPWMHGIPVRQVMRTLVPDMPDARVEEMQQFMVEGESTDTVDVVPMPGAVELLRFLPPDRWAIVTSGGDRLAAARIAAAGLPHPRSLVTADDVTMGKPAPDPYLAGARALGLEPGACLAFEDAPPGMESAVAAGMPVIGIATTHPDLTGPAVVKSLADISFSVQTDRIRVSW